MMMRLLLALSTTVMLAAPETLLQKLLRIAGLTASPSQMRGPGDEFEPGEVWLLSLGGTPAPLTLDGGYSSPIFSPADGTLFALKSGALVRIPGSGGAGVAVRKIPGAHKLVGFDGDNPDEVVVLMKSEAPSPLVILSLRSGKLTPLPYDRNSEDQSRMLAQVRGQQRVYGDVTVYTKTESKQGISRTIEWTDVYLQRGDGTPLNVSACDGAKCGQPALSPDNRKIAFVKSAR